MKQSFVTAINCIDGRTQETLIVFLKTEFSAEYVDLVTEPGPDKVLSENKALDIIQSVKRRTLISVQKHKSKIVIVAGHHDCAANPVEKEEHYRQIKQAVQNIKQWNLGISVYGVWIDSDWKVGLVG